MNESNMAPPMVPIAPGTSANYSMRTSDGVVVTWTYELDVSQPGPCEGCICAACGSDLHRVVASSPCHIGTLDVRGVEVHLGDAAVGQRVRTPWGTMVRVQSEVAQGWMLDDSGGEPTIPVPAAALDREGEWRASAKTDSAFWQYTERVSALGTRSEMRRGRLSYDRQVVVGVKRGDYVDTPWGRMRWIGAEPTSGTIQYESGFMLRGTYDRGLDDMPGDVIVPVARGVGAHFRSLYLEAGASFDGGEHLSRGVALVLARSLDAHDDSDGRLVLDPNGCALGPFGDREGCTKAARTIVPVSVSRLRIADPMHHGRRLYQVRGERLVGDHTLIMEADGERCALKVGAQLVPLFREFVIDED